MNRPSPFGVRVLSCLVLLSITSPGWSQEGKILDQQLDANGHGYTVLKVWGTPQQMGYAQGYFMASAIVKIVGVLQQQSGAQYAGLRTAASAAKWQPGEIEQELDGLVEGIKAAQSSATLDKGDLKVLNAMGDLINPPACRSHSAWGKFVAAPTRTLSTRRVDYTLPAGLKPVVYHHLVLARQPEGGGVRWVTLGIPGLVGTATAVSEYGTLVSLHDYNSQVAVGAHLPRTLAARLALTMVKGLPLDQHLAAVYGELQKHTIMTRTFINYYVPEGHGGVLTCNAGQTCSKKRVPQSDYHGGAVLITTNAETDGHSTPAGGEFINSYYSAGGIKTIADHFELMGHDDIELLSVDYRGPGDLTIWAEGTQSSGVTPIIKLEFSEVFASSSPLDGGSSPSDGGVRPGDQGSTVSTDGGSVADATRAGDQKTGGGGCRIGGGRPSEVTLFLLLLLPLIGRRARRSSRGDRA